MLTADKTQVQIALGFLDSCTDPQTGFLPSKAPFQILPEPFRALSEACGELVQHYTGQSDNCRPWLTSKFKQANPAWSQALKDADEHLTDAVMTQASLLCHAYLCGNANGIGIVDLDPPPAGLDQLWAEVSQKLDVPKAGNFFALITSNWKIEAVTPGDDYDFNSVETGATRVLYRWVPESLSGELDSFLGFFLAMEAKGHHLVETISELLRCIVHENSQEATYHMMMLSAGIASLSADFNTAYKKSKAAPKEFGLVFKPTLVLGEEEGASGLQSCSFQLLESFFGLDQETEFGQAVVQARRLMNVERRKLLQVLDMTSPVVRKFVESSRSPRLLEAFNRCLSHLKTWRLLYVKRGSLLSRTERETPIVTQAPLLEGDWVGMEWSLDSLFRFLTEDQQAQFTRSVREMTFQAGEVIIQQGDLFPGLFELQSGSASVTKGQAGEEEVVDKIGANEVFGEMSLVENLPASARIVADVELRARHLSLETVYDILNKHRDAEGGFYLALAQLISHRLRNAFPD